MIVPETAGDLDTDGRALICLLRDDFTLPSSADREQIRQPTAVSGRTLAIFHEAATYPVLERLAKSRQGSRFLGMMLKLGRYLEYRRYPRNGRYMDTLIARSLPSLGSLQSASACSLASVNWSEIAHVILLWPDANGTGWFQIERRVFSLKPHRASVYVLNGRGRFFSLKRGTWRSYLFRRALEKSFVPETFAFIVFLLTSPFIALWDVCTKREQ